MNSVLWRIRLAMQKLGVDGDKKNKTLLHHGDPPQQFEKTPDCTPVHPYMCCLLPRSALFDLSPLTFELLTLSMLIG